MIRFTRRGGYECSTKGDKRFSALVAKMPDGRTIEQWYQCDIKGYQVGGTDWRLGKGKAPLLAYPQGQLREMYKSLWRIWAIHNHMEMAELLVCAKAHGNALTDCFATTPINQAAILAEILNEWFGG